MMVVIVVYTLILLFVDKNAVSNQCINALEQWYQHMIPALFPMMLCSSVLVDTGVSHQLGGFLSNTLLKPFRMSKSGGYCFLTGFLFGFPMGAKTTAELYAKGHITKEEAEYLLSFVNCIGPMYSIYVVHNLFENVPLSALLFGIYGVPMLYGLILRYSLYRNVQFDTENDIKQTKLSIMDALYESVPKSSKAMVYLGGYMILFQISFVTLENILRLLHFETKLLFPLLEITGGLYLLQEDISLPVIVFYTIWGGASCFLQTYSFLKPSNLSMKKYVIHKTIQAILGFLVSCLFVVAL